LWRLVRRCLRPARRCTAFLRPRQFHRHLPASRREPLMATPALRLATLALLCAAAAPGPALPGDVELRLPVPGACISSPFGTRRAVGPHAALSHNGVDLPAAAGTWVGATATGRVVAVRPLGSSGLEVDIAHGPPGGGFLTRYAHLGSVAPAIATGRTEVS